MTFRATGLPIGDVSGYAKRFCNVFNAEDCKLQLVEFPIAHLLQYYGKFAAESAEGFEQADWEMV